MVWEMEGLKERGWNEESWKEGGVLKRGGGEIETRAQKRDGGKMWRLRGKVWNKDSWQEVVGSKSWAEMEGGYVELKEKEEPV